MIDVERRVSFNNESYIIRIVPTRDGRLDVTGYSYNELIAHGLTVDASVHPDEAVKQWYKMMEEKYRQRDEQRRRAVEKMLQRAQRIEDARAGLLDDELVTGFLCPYCEHVYDDDPDNEPDPSYECGICGSQFTRSETDYGNHQCPHCYKYGSKLANNTCEQCQEPVDEFIQVRAIEVDEELVNIDE